MPYSEVADLLTGNIPVSSGIAQKYVQDATDEIDSVLGVMYQTPINIGEGTPVKRHSVLLLKRINNFLASGRLMLATAAGGEDDQLHAYAKYLVDTATAALMKIATGEIKLDGAPLDSTETDVDPGVYGPLIENVDSESNVEAFYDRIYMAPAMVQPNSWRWPGG